MDELCALFILLSVLSLYRDQWVTAGLMWGIACSLKVFVLLPTIIIPLLIITIKKRTAIDKYLSFVFVSFGVFLVASLPFLVWNFNGYVSSLLWRLGFAGWTFDLGLSYGVTLSVILQSGIGLLAFVSFIPTAVFIILFSYLILHLLRSKDKFEDFDGLNKSILAIALIAYLGTIVVNEMDYIWIMPLLLLYLGPRTKQIGKWFLALNLILLAAVMIDWTPLDFIPGIPPSLVTTYQIHSQLRVIALAGLGAVVSLVVLFGLLRIFDELEHKTRRRLI